MAPASILTRPDPVLIHNWAFASIVFGESLGRLDAVLEVLTGAMAQPLIADAIALARATRSAGAGEDTIELDAIRGENRDTFYSALGRRLAWRKCGRGARDHVHPHGLPRKKKHRENSFGMTAVTLVMGAYTEWRSISRGAGCEVHVRTKGCRLIAGVQRCIAGR